MVKHYSNFNIQKKDKGIEKVAKEYEVIVNFIQSDLKW